MTPDIPHSLCDDILAALRPGDDLVERMAALLRSSAGRIVLTTSFGLEDQVLTHVAAAAMALPEFAGLRRRIELATLDTGRLFAETLDVWAATERRHGLRVASVAPDTATVEALVAAQGVEGFRDSVDARRACCGVRKVAPLHRALAGASLWITGLRADQSAAREATPFATWDEQFGVVKAAPLADWSREDVARFAAANRVPLNALHARGFLSIGCAPCTRAVAPGEPERAGRWWWEDEARKECGLHRRPSHAAAAPTPEALVPATSILETTSWV
jgi:phosphoadenosine phosphosulfate reductase